MEDRFALESAGISSSVFDEYNSKKLSDDEKKLLQKADEFYKNQCNDNL